MKNNFLYCYAACTESLKKDINHGIWLDCTWEVDEMQSEIDRMISNSLFYPETDWRIIRFDVPKGFDFLSDQTSLEVLHDMAMFVDRFDDLGVALLNHLQGDVLEAGDAIHDRCLGHFDSVEQFAKSRIGRSQSLIDEIKNAIDYKKLWAIWQKKYYVALHVKGLNGVAIFRK